MAQTRKRDYERAIQNCDDALAGADPNDKVARAEGLHKRGEINRKYGHFVEALSDLNESLALNPSFAAGFAARGGVKRNLGKYDSAIEDFNASLEVCKDPEVRKDVLVSLSAAKRALGKLPEAAADIDEAVSLGKRTAFTLQLRGELRRKLGRCEEAISDCSDALQLNPCYVPALAGRAAARRRLGKLEEAIRDFDTAISLTAPDANLLSDRGFTKFRMELHNEAIEDYHQALKLDPEHRFAKWALNELEKSAEQGAVFLRRSFILEGFARNTLNTRFLECREQLVNTRETWWAADKEHFFYWCEDERRWKATVAAHLEKTQNGGKPGVASSPLEQPHLDLCGKRKWYEWDSLVWQVPPGAGVKAAGPANDLIRLVTLSGFKLQPAFNTEYDENRNEAFSVNFRETYWDSDRKFFLFWCKKEFRWKGGQAKDFEAIKNGRSAANIAAPQKGDLLRTSYLLGWHEFNTQLSKWVLVQGAGVSAVSHCKAAEAQKEAT